MKLSDLTFEKISSYDPFHERADNLGLLWEWVARNSYGNSVAFGYTKKECIADARRYVRYFNQKKKPQY